MLLHLTRTPQSTRTDDGLEIRQGGLEIVIPDEVVVLTTVAHFADCRLHAIVNHGVAVLGAGSQALLKRGSRGRQDEDRHRIFELGTNLTCALPVNLDQHITASRLHSPWST